ncbi:MAG: virulence-associated protein VapB-like protein [Comamonadaceae bacterium]|nr:MAG: virulence-associated protein VapB-like protein [Comamonadaceae bacterium]
MPIVSEKAADYLLPAPTPEAPARHVRLFRNGANQALRIPKEFELPGKEAEIRQIGKTLVITPIDSPPATLRDLLDSWEPMDEDFPDVDEGLLPLDDIVL